MCPTNKGRGKTIWKSLNITLVLITERNLYYYIKLVNRKGHRINN